LLVLPGELRGGEAHFLDISQMDVVESERCTKLTQRVVLVNNRLHVSGLWCRLEQGWEARQLEAT